MSRLYVISTGIYVYVSLCVVYTHIHTYMNVIIANDTEAMNLKRNKGGFREGWDEGKGWRDDVL